MISTDWMDTEGRHKHRQTDSGRVVCLAGLCVRPRVVHDMLPAEVSGPSGTRKSGAAFDVDRAIRAFIDYAAALRQETDEYRRAGAALAAYRPSTRARPTALVLLRTPAKPASLPTEWGRLFESLPALAEKARLMRMERRAASTR